MSDITSKLVSSISASEVTNQRIKKRSGIPLLPGQRIAYMVLKVRLENKTYYCCLSGGEMVDGEPRLTEVGNAALEALVALPVGRDDALVLQELKIGPTPLKQKIKSFLRRHPSGTKVCFFGDMAGELDGVAFDAFNVKGETAV